MCSERLTGTLTLVTSSPLEPGSVTVAEAVIQGPESVIGFRAELVVFEGFLGFASVYYRAHAPTGNL